MFGIGGWEMLLIGVVALLVFGPKRLPELARTMGKGLAEFRRASSDLRRSIELDMDPQTISAPKPETLPPAQAGSPAQPEAAHPEGAQTDPDPTHSDTYSEAHAEGDPPADENRGS